MDTKAKKASKGIVTWPEDERPRERLLSRGTNALTDAELLAILIRVGFEGTNAVELGRNLLKQFGTLRAIGFERTGPRIKETLGGDLIAAVRRGIL